MTLAQVPSEVTIRLDFATRDALTAFPRGAQSVLAAAHAGNHEGARAAGAPRSLGSTTWLEDGIQLTQSSAACTCESARWLPRTGRSVAVEGGAVGADATDGVMIEARYRCPESSPIELTLPFIARLPPAHRHEARITRGAATQHELLFGASARLRLVPFESPDESVLRAQERSARTSMLQTWSLRRALGFMRLGFSHILSGADHIAFVLALVVGLRGRRTLLAALTAFTIAHSLTLGLGVSGLLALPPSWVEPAIALSVVYAGFENLRGSGTTPRVLTTFVFGLLHGSGFAGALTELALPSAELGAALLSFNVGVELGQLVVVALTLPVFWLASRRRSLRPPNGAKESSSEAMKPSGLESLAIRPVVSLMLMACGLFWFGTRL